MALLEKHTHFHFHFGDMFQSLHTKIDQQTAMIEANNKLINSKLDNIMTKQEKFDASLERLNTSTNDIAADLKQLKEEYAAGTISDESLAKLDANVATLEALGASTENPVPGEGSGE